MGLVRGAHVDGFLHRAADLTLVPSAAIIKDLIANNVQKLIRYAFWNKGIDSKSFHPRYYRDQMRARLSNGQSEKPLLIHLRRTGREKNLDFLKRIMDRLLGVRIAIIGHEPYGYLFFQSYIGDYSSYGVASVPTCNDNPYIFTFMDKLENIFVVLVSMSSGTPVVAARAGGIPDIIPEEHEGKTSFLYTPGDLDDCPWLRLHARRWRSMIGGQLRESFAMRIIMQQSGSGRRTNLIFLDQSSPLPEGSLGHLKTLVVEVIQRHLL